MSAMRDRLNQPSLKEWSMSFERFLASITDPALIAVAAHWNEARSDRLMPAWRDIDPAAIREHLPMVWSWRWDAALGTFIGRLAGEEIIAVLGKNTRGKSIEEVFRPDAQAVVLARYKRVMSDPVLMHSSGKVFLLSGGTGDGERIVLPLAADGRHGDGVIGATVYRLGIRPTKSDRIAIDHHGEVIDFFPLV
jgi:hypothetical protein